MTVLTLFLCSLSWKRHYPNNPWILTPPLTTLKLKKTKKTNYLLIKKQHEVNAKLCLLCTEEPKRHEAGCTVAAGPYKRGTTLPGLPDGRVNLGNAKKAWPVLFSLSSRSTILGQSHCSEPIPNLSHWAQGRNKCAIFIWV